MVFGADEPVPGEITTLCREFSDRTRDYWMDWVRRLSIAYDWQDEIIRAAITLKLSNFEETGGIIAAHTTSIPEAPGSGRTWDYRFCWLRDAYFVVKALNRIGATQTMVTRPTSPRTIRITPELPLRIGMKSITVTAPSSVRNLVSRMRVWSRYLRLAWNFSASGAIRQRPLSGVPRSAAKHASESNRGQHSQSIEPSRETSAAVSQSPIRA